MSSFLESATYSAPPAPGLTDSVGTNGATTTFIESDVELLIAPYANDLQPLNLTHDQVTRINVNFASWLQSSNIMGGHKRMDQIPAQQQQKAALQYLTFVGASDVHLTTAQSNLYNSGMTGVHNEIASESTYKTVSDVVRPTHIVYTLANSHHLHF